MFSYGMVELTAELKALIVAESQNEGQVLYRDLKVGLEPLTQWVIRGAEALFGRNFLVMKVAGLILIFFQGFYFNFICNSLQVFPTRSMLPLFFYYLLPFLFPDWISLSGPLLAQSVILILFHQLWLSIRGDNLDRLFWIGLLSSIPALFFFPYWVMIPAVLLLLLIYTSMNPARLVLFFFAALIPLMVLGLVQFMANNFIEFVQVVGQRMFMPIHRFALSYASALTYVGVPVFIMLCSIWAINQGARLLIFQFRIIRFHFYFIILMIPSIFFWSEAGGQGMLCLLGIMAFFATHFFLLIKKRWLGSLVLMSFLAAGFGLHYSIYQREREEAFKAKYAVFLPELTAKASQSPSMPIWAWAPGYLAYRDARLASPYPEWERIEYAFMAPQEYQNLELIYDILSNHKPSFIYDPQGYMLLLRKRIPMLFEWYEESEVKPGLYRFKK